MYLPQIAGGFFLFATAYAAVGPIADLVIGNGNIQPDGYSRSWVVYRLSSYYGNSLWTTSAVLVGSTKDSLEFPAPLIQATKAGVLPHYLVVFTASSCDGRL